MTTAPALRRTLRLRDLVLLNLIAAWAPATVQTTLVLGRWGLVLWTIGIVVFRWPATRALADLAVAHPREGGGYAWTRMAFGPFHGFVYGWCYWVQNLVFLPMTFIGIVSVAALLVPNGPALVAHSPTTVAVAACGIAWALTLAQLAGLDRAKSVQNVGGATTVVVTVAFLALGAWAATAPAGATTAAMPRATLPAPTTLLLLGTWAFVVNGLAGMELSLTMTEEACDPRRDVPRGLVVSVVVTTVCCLGMYLAELAIGVGLDDPLTGHLVAVRAATRAAFGAGTLASSAATVASLVVLAELIGRVGSATAWVGGPARIPFVVGIDRYLPPAFGRVHARTGAPWVALVVQGVVVTVFIVANVYGVSVQEAYVTLMDASLFFYLVTYAYVLAAWPRLVDGGRGTRALAAVGVVATVVSMIACFLPSASVTDVPMFEAKVALSLAAIFVPGLVAYRRGVRRVTLAA